MGWKQPFTPFFRWKSLGQRYPGFATVSYSGLLRVISTVGGVDLQAAALICVDSSMFSRRVQFQVLGLWSFFDFLFKVTEKLSP